MWLAAVCTGWTSDQRSASGEIHHQRQRTGSNTSVQLSTTSRPSVTLRSERRLLARTVRVVPSVRGSSFSATVTIASHGRSRLTCWRLPDLWAPCTSDIARSETASYRRVGGWGRRRFECRRRAITLVGGPIPKVGGARRGG